MPDRSPAQRLVDRLRRRLRRRRCPRLRSPHDRCGRAECRSPGGRRCGSRLRRRCLRPAGGAAVPRRGTLVRPPRTARRIRSGLPRTRPVACRQPPGVRVVGELPLHARGLRGLPAGAASRRDARAARQQPGRADEAPAYGTRCPRGSRLGRRCLRRRRGEPEGDAVRVPRAGACPGLLGCAAGVTRIRGRDPRVRSAASPSGGASRRRRTPRNPGIDRAEPHAPCDRRSTLLLSSRARGPGRAPHAHGRHCARTRARLGRAPCRGGEGGRLAGGRLRRQREPAAGSPRCSRSVASSSSSDWRS